MANKRISDLPADTAPTGTDVVPVDGTTTRKVALSDLFGTINKVGTLGAGTWQATTIAIAYGGTGSTTPSGARANLGLAIGSNVQAWNVNLDAFALKSAPSGVVVGTSDTQAITNKDLSGAGNTFPTFNQNTTGSASTLTTPRTIDGQSFNGSANITVVAPATHAATSKTTPVDADEVPLIDSASSFALARLTWANLKATVKTFYDSATKTLTNTTIDTAGAGNSLLVAGVAMTANTGTGAVVRASSPSLSNPDVTTQATADNSTKAASTAYVTAKVAASTSGVSQLNGQTGALNVRVIQQTFPNSATYTPSSGMQFCVVEGFGSGGGAGGSVGSTGQLFGGGGGAAGQYVRSRLTAVQVGASQAVTISAGGTGGTGAANGGAGGDTSLGTLVVAKGGAGGLYGAAAQVGSGGVGSATSGVGDWVQPGGSGGFGAYNASAFQPASPSGFGGVAAFGSGAPAPNFTAGAATAGITSAGRSGGGSGAISSNTAGTAKGGDGAAGFMIITEYCVS